MIRYAISDRSQFPGDETARRAALVQQVERLSSQGIDYFQLREKDLGGSELVSLAREVVAAARANGTMKVLINADADAAKDSGANGIHLPPGTLGDLLPAMTVSVGCHTMDEVAAAAERRPSLILLSPIFGKSVWGEEVLPAAGLDFLKQGVAAARGVPVIALGNISAENTQACIDAGAAGVAGIRLFLDDASNRT